MLFCTQNQIQFKLERCCQCGACLASCPSCALTRTWRDNGLFMVHCNVDKCTKCQECVRVCPSIILPDLKLTEDDWKAVRQVYLGHAIKESIRYNASSGGIARTIIRNTLEKGACRWVYTVLESDKYPWAMGGYITRESFKARISNSMYRPLPVCENLRKLTSGKLLVVGTHCQLLAVEAFYRSSEVELVKICILCKQQKTLDFSRFMAKRLRVPDYRNTRIQYRGDGWPGEITMAKKKMPYEEAAALPFGKGLWRVPGCRFCTHPLGARADLTLADPWKITSDEKSGMTLILVRTEEGEKLLDLCREDAELKGIPLALAQISIDWNGIKCKQERTEYYLGNSMGLDKRMKYKIGELQRALYEKLLLSTRIPKLALKVLNKVPFWG
jgi:coenzyme F420-reducing hydrogenase beta subunit